MKSTVAFEGNRTVAYLSLALMALAFAAIRLYVAQSLELSPDEAYYWTWSRMEGPCYPDHPPLVARLIELGTRLAGDTSLGVRLPAVLFGEIHLLLMYALLRLMGLSRPWSVGGAGIGCALPIVSAGSVIMTPDVPLGLSWTVATLCLVVLARRSCPAAWFGLACALCFAFFSKLSAPLIAVMAFSAFAVSPRLRSDAATPAPYLAGLLCAGFLLIFGREILSCPHVQTQIDHLGGRLVPSGADVSIAGAPARILELLAGQLGLLTPLIFWFGAMGIFKRRRDPAMQVLGLSFAVPLIATVISALTTHPEQNWASLGHPALGAAAFFQLATSPSNLRKTVATSAFVLAAFAAIHIHATWTLLPLPSAKDPVSRLHGWSNIDYLLKNIENHGVVLTDGYGLAAQIVWSQRRHPTTLRAVVAVDRSGPPGRADVALLVAPCDVDGECRDDSTPFECESYGSFRELPMFRSDGRIARTIWWRIGYDCRFEQGFRLVKTAAKD